MDIRRTKINRKIKIFLDEFKKIAPLDKAFLFGSYAKGKANKWSDIDLAVISNIFKDKNNFERLVMLGKLAYQAKTTEIEALGFTPREYQNVAKWDFLYEIKNKGIKIYP